MSDPTLLQLAINPRTLAVRDLPDLDKIRVILYEIDDAGCRSILELWEWDLPTRYYRTKLVKQIRSGLSDFAENPHFSIVLERVPA